MERAKKLYSQWLQRELEDACLTQELKEIESNPKEIYERFYTDLSFGTGGLRGIIGAGTNRMNIYTIRRATQGLAQYIRSAGNSCPSVAIAYDSRNKSQLFAKAAAEVFAANGIKVYLYKELMPTPMLSYAVRRLGCQAGVVVTASHNPAAYNGYKVYNSEGCQLNTEASQVVLNEINGLDIFEDVLRLDFEEAMEQDSICYIRQEVIDSYLDQVLKVSLDQEICKESCLKVVYTPLNGSGNKPVRAVLERIGVRELYIVREQELPDGNFPTCPYPNPESRQALELGIKLMEEKAADLLIATDPDADRVGIAVRHQGECRLIGGNEAGVLLFAYICEQRIAQGTMPKHPVAMKSFVTTSMVEELAKHYGVEVLTLLTGFKYIGEQIGRLEKLGEAERFILGYEESYGYLCGTYVRDKDAVAGAMLMTEMAAYYKKQGKTLIDAMEDLYQSYGYHYNHVDNLAFEGSDGMHKMAAIMKKLCENSPQKLGGCSVETVYDYTKRQKRSSEGLEPIALPATNAIAFEMAGGHMLVVRPSGTEPKLKVYYMIKGPDRAACEVLAAGIAEELNTLLGI